MFRRIKKSVVVHLILVVLFLSAYAQVASASEKVFMWKVRSPQATAYIFGSVHFMKKEMYPLDERIESAFKESGSLVLEFDINSVDKAKVEATMLSDAVYKKGDSVANHISKDTYDLAQKKFEEYGFPFSILQSFKPWYLGLTIQSLALMKLGFDPQYGIEKYLLEEAAGTKKIVELESFDSQIGIFKTMSEREQELFLRQSLDDVEQMQTGMDDLMNAWAEGDAKSLEEQLMKGLQDDPRMAPLFEKMFYERNRAMAARIEQLLKKKGTYFIAVGAGHLVGKKGIVQILSRKGYAVRQQ